MAVVQPAPDSSISEVICTNLDYAQYSCAPKRGEHGDGHPRIPEQGVPLCLMRLGACAPSCGDHQSVGAVGDGRARSGRYAAQALGLSRRQVYVLIRRARQGSGLVTDLVPGQSGGGKGKGRLPEPVERVIHELLQKRS
ncbi:hypothetical protein DKG79_23505 (plasmid) [Escherichia fergusonii]|nr:hypothetical protein DKG79_23505 [Escherichia fergusonii]